MPRILVAEFSPYVDALLDDLRARGHEVEVVTSVAAVRVALDAFGPDVVLLGEQLVDVDGLVAVQELTGKVPLMFVCRELDQQTRTVALKLGADDAITLPIPPSLLDAKIDALIRRHAPPGPAASGPPDSTTLGQLQIRRATHLITVDNIPIHLTRTEWRLFDYLIVNANRVVTRDELSRKAWGEPHVGQALYVHLDRIRRKLRTAGCKSPRLVNVRGTGYRFILAEGDYA